MRSKLMLVSGTIFLCLISGLMVGYRKLYKWEEETRGFRQSAGIVRPPVSPADQAKLLAVAKQYTILWIAGNYNQMYPLVSPRAFIYHNGNPDFFIRLLHRQRKSATYHVLSSAKLENIHLISVPRQGVASFFVVSLDPSAFAQFMKGKWPNWSGDHVAVVKFFLQKKYYRQVGRKINLARGIASICR